MYVDTFYDAVVAAKTILQHDPKVRRVLIAWPGTSFPTKADSETVIVECKAQLPPTWYVLENGDALGHDR